MGVVVQDVRDLGAFIPSNLDDFGLSVYAFRLYSHYARRAGRDGGIWTSNATAAEVCCMSERQVARARSELVNHGLIKVTKRPGRTDLIALLPVATPATQAEVVPDAVPATPDCESGQVGLSVIPTDDCQSDEGFPREGFPKKVSGAPAKRARKRDLLFEAVVEACGMSLGSLTRSARGVTNRAVMELREAGANPETVTAAAKQYRVQFRDAALTPSALAKHYPKLVPREPTNLTLLTELCHCGAVVTEYHQPDACRL